MESILYMVLGAVVLCQLSVIIVKFPKTQLYLFFLLACILPSYFAIELSESLPLITGTRLLIMLLMLYALTHKKYCSFRKVLKLSKVQSIFAIYFICRIIAEVSFITSLTGYVIKELFNIIFEEFLIVYLIVRSINSRKVYDKCVKMLAYGAVIICVIGIMQSITGVNLSYFLNTVNRSMLQTNAFRLGFTRAEASFGHPVYFGEFCVLMLPIFSYLHDYKEEKKYLYFLVIDIIALLLSNSRGAILPGMIILVLMVGNKSSKVQWKYFCTFLICCVGFLGIMVLVPSAAETIISIIKSIMNIFGANFDLGNYGSNSSGLESRANQLSGIMWVIMNGVVLFGFGPDAHMRGYVSYFINNHWSSLETIDVGYVGFFLCEGLIGTVGQLTLIFGLVFRALKLKNRNEISNMNNAFFYVFLGHAILLLSATGLGITYWTLIGLFIAYNNIEIRQGE